MGPRRLGRLAGAVVAGHVIECGAQATGGNYSFFTEVEGMARVGFPWAEVSTDGSSVIGKHDGTGGEVSIGTVTSQLLYEIAAPVPGPRRAARFDTIQLDQVARDRVRISGAQGEPPATTFKVAINEIGGYRKDLSVALTGLDIEAKARLVRMRSGSRARTRRRLRQRDDPSSPNRQGRSPHQRRGRGDVATDAEGPRRAQGRASVANAVVEIALATVPGFFNIGGMPRAGGAFGIYCPALVGADLVAQYVTILGESTTP